MTLTAPDSVYWPLSLQVCASQSSFALDTCFLFSNLAFIFSYCTASSLDIPLLVYLLLTYQEKAAEVSTPSSKQRKWYRKYYSCLPDCSRKTYIKLFTEAHIRPAALVLGITWFSRVEEALSDSTASCHSTLAWSDLINMPLKSLCS